MKAHDGAKSDAGKSIAGTEAGRGATSGTTASVWHEDASPVLRTTVLGADVEADVCVVGAGIAGMTTAYLLAKAGRRVVVLDDGPIGGGETGRTTAHFVNALDDRWYEIERLHGEEGARLAADSHTRAIDRVEEIVTREGIDCAFERLDGHLFVPPGESAEPLEREAAAAAKAGVPGVRRIARAPLPFDTGPALVFPRQAQLHPLRYLAGLRRAIEAAGGRIHTGTHVAEVEESTPARVRTGHGPVVTAAAVVVATNSPVIDRTAIHTKQAPYRTYVIALPMPAGSAPRGLFWDTSERRGDPDPYHYLRTFRDRGGETLISGGQDHPTGAPEDAAARFARLEAWTRERFPAAGEVSRRWSGQVMEPFDGLAFLGRNPGSKDHVYVITGDSGNGMTHCTIGAEVVTDLILGRENPWASLYDPGRITLKVAVPFLKFNTRPMPHGVEVADEADIARGDGALVRRGARVVAVYRDEKGECRRMSPVCPHLGCFVSWNGGEKSWDCPCHGSRFDRHGKVVNGPANADLTPAGAPPRPSAEKERGAR
jgi:glycine/D-amino acid oxidase-like deaminating enzyme/nitrite reductase/ring-hydroxylating ferredoxin subunit